MKTPIVSPEESTISELEDQLAEARKEALYWQNECEAMEEYALKALGKTPECPKATRIVQELCDEVVRLRKETK